MVLAMLVCLAGAIDAASAQSAPEPARVSPSWTLDFEHQQPRVLTVREPNGRLRWFWYMPYKVTNHTREPQSLIPDVTVAYDNGAIIDADKNVPARVYTLVQERVGNPLMTTPAKMTGTMLQGEDYARESVAIWEHPDESERGPAGEMRVFFAGLSGETAAIAHPSEEGQTIVLHRTRMLKYHLPGRPRTPREQPVVFEAAEDVMR
ncbi:MAG: hypothetical protein WD009_06485 [Phycisphaeraceae bacterium]